MFLQLLVFLRAVFYAFVSIYKKEHKILKNILTNEQLFNYNTDRIVEQVFNYHK